MKIWKSLSLIEKLIFLKLSNTTPKFQFRGAKAWTYYYVLDGTRNNGVAILRESYDSLIQ